MSGHPPSHVPVTCLSGREKLEESGEGSACAWVRRGPCRPRTGSILSTGKPGWSEELPAHPGERGVMFPPLAKSLQRGRGFARVWVSAGVGAGAHGRMLSQSCVGISETHVLPCRHPVLTSGGLSLRSPREWMGARLRGLRCTCAMGALPLPPLAISRLPRAGPRERPLLKCYRMARDAFGSPAKACQRRFER